MIFADRPHRNIGFVVMAAKDPVGVPTDPVIVAIAEKALCRISLGIDCFVLTNVYGRIAEVPYGASVEEWERIAYGLLDAAMKEAE